MFWTYYGPKTKFNTVTTAILNLFMMATFMHTSACWFHVYTLHYRLHPPYKILCQYLNTRLKYNFLKSWISENVISDQWFALGCWFSICVPNFGKIMFMENCYLFSDICTEFMKSPNHNVWHPLSACRPKFHFTMSKYFQFFCMVQTRGVSQTTACSWCINALNQRYLCWTLHIPYMVHITNEEWDIRLHINQSPVSLETRG